MEPVNLRKEPLLVVKETPRETRRRFGLPHAIMLLAVIAITALVSVYKLFLSPPKEFAQNTIVIIESGDSLAKIGERLESAKVVRSAEAFRLIARLQKAAHAEAGPYRFENPTDVFGVVLRFATSAHGIVEVSVTIPEGWSRVKMANRLTQKLPLFATSTFMIETEGLEGALFPDTYRFYAIATSGEVVRVMRENFNKKTIELQKEAELAGRSWSDVVTLASILELEGRGNDERSMIADILNRRIASGMRLQVDAPFMYILGKGSLQLTRDDLFIDSPYNTYRHEGLPKGPIGNPGVGSLSAAVRPTANEYLFYLHDTAGGIHYAKTNAEHVRNKQRFLR